MMDFPQEFLHGHIEHLFAKFNAIYADVNLTSHQFSFEKEPQKFLSALAYSKKLNELLASSECARDLNLLIHGRSPHAADWLLQLPRHTSEMTSLQWIISFYHHFSIPVYQGPETRCLCCRLNSINDIYGDHAVSCPGGFLGSTSARTFRHNRVRFVLNEEMNLASWTTSVETKNLLSDNYDARPADIFVQGVRNECIDVTVVDSVGDWSSAQLYDPADQLIKAANAKHEKYDASCQREHLAFSPFVMGALGGFGEEALNIISRVAESQCRLGISHYSRNEIAQFMCQRLSFEIRKCQSKSILERMPMIEDEDEREGVGKGDDVGEGE
jgi:hypothetical protein